jgi:hypothetical protein
MSTSDAPSASSMVSAPSRVVLGSSGPTVLPTGGVSSTSAAAGATTTSDNKSSRSSGLSGGVEAAIAVGASVVALTILAGIALMLRRRSKRQLEAKHREYGYTYPKQAFLYEAGGMALPAEADPGAARVELEGSFRGYEMQTAKSPR